MIRQQVELCSSCKDWRILGDNGLCEDCTPKPEFTKKDIASIGMVKEMEKAIGNVDHLFSYQCDTCIKMSEDPDYNIQKVRWFAQSMNEAETLKYFHETNNDGHVGVCYER